MPSQTERILEFSAKLSSFEIADVCLSPRDRDGTSCGEGRATPLSPYSKFVHAHHLLVISCLMFQVFVGHVLKISCLLSDRVSNVTGDIVMVFSRIHDLFQTFAFVSPPNCS